MNASCYLHECVEKVLPSEVWRFVCYFEGGKCEGAGKTR